MFPFYFSRVRTQRIFVLTPPKLLGCCSVPNSWWPFVFETKRGSICRSIQLNIEIKRTVSQKTLVLFLSGLNTFWGVLIITLYTLQFLRSTITVKLEQYMLSRSIDLRFDRYVRSFLSIISWSFFVFTLCRGDIISWSFFGFTLCRGDAVVGCTLLAVSCRIILSRHRNDSLSLPFCLVHYPEHTYSSRSLSFSLFLSRGEALPLSPSLSRSFSIPLYFYIFIELSFSLLLTDFISLFRQEHSSAGLATLDPIQPQLVTLCTFLIFDCDRQSTERRGRHVNKLCNAR